MSLAENHLRRLPSAIFDDLRNVERLTLAGNSEMKDLPRRLFRNQHAKLQVEHRFYTSLVRSKVVRAELLYVVINTFYDQHGYAVDHVCL